MKSRTIGLGVFVLVMLVCSGCDSGQYEQSTNTGPKAENIPMSETEALIAKEPPKVEGALLANVEAAGAKDNEEGINHYQQEHWDVAQEHFSKALATNANLPEAHYNLALALDKRGNHAEATIHFKMALSLAPEDPRIKDSAILKAHVSG